MFKNLLIAVIQLIATGPVLLAQDVLQSDVLVVGGGAGGVAAGIQSARLGARTMIVEPGPWLGGMLTAGGVSATDGNHRLPSGIWAEFRQQLYRHYGSAEALATGWVSNTQFEPHVGDSILKAMARGESGKLEVRHGWWFQDLLLESGRVKGAVFTNAAGARLTVRATVTIDATELGDLMEKAAVPFDLGMEAGAVTGENVGVNESNDIVQDLTYVAILKDYGRGVDCTIVKPQGFDPAEFDGACTDYYLDQSLPKPTVNAAKMLEYGKLPGDKYMLNWPNRGNDTYLNIVQMEEAARQRELQKAKATTLRFVYFIQQQLGYKNLGLANDEFPTPDRLALMPYHREGRRLKGVTRLTINHIADPYGNGQPLYRTGISVGDYPIDHHHKKNPAAPQHLGFYPVPSYSIPLGSLVPAGTPGLIIAEKGISVSNVANGTTRLQPAVLLTGQAAGTLAALGVRRGMDPVNIPVREVQLALLESGAMIQPFLDVPPSHPNFLSIHKVGVTGLLKGRGIPFNWANQTWFYPDSTVNSGQFSRDLKEFVPVEFRTSGQVLTQAEAIEAARLAAGWKKPARPAGKRQWTNDIISQWGRWGLGKYEAGAPVTRAQLAVLLDKSADPFSRPVALDGQFAMTKPR